MMRDPRPVVRTAEKVAGIIAIVAALVVLNGAWENQHTWQNLSWRVAIAALLLALAVIVQTSAVGVLQARRQATVGTSVPDFLRATAEQDERSANDVGRTEEAAGVDHRR